MSRLLRLLPNPTPHTGTHASHTRTDTYTSRSSTTTTRDPMRFLSSVGVLLGCYLLQLLLQPVTSFSVITTSPLSSKGSTRATAFARKSVVLKPTLLIQHTGGELGEKKKEAFIAEASKIVASTLGKPESYVMVGLTHATMSFAGKPGNAAFLYLASIGHIGPETNKPAAKELTALVEKHLGITGERVFIQFSDAKASDFAWQGRTFG